MIRQLLTYLVLILATSCGNGLSLTNEQEIEVVIYGVNTAPDSATGNQSPQFYELQFVNLILNQTSGDPVTLTPSSTETYKVINRPQIVYSESISDYESVEFSSAAATFTDAVVVGGKYRSDYTLTLTDPVFEVTEAFSVEKGKGLKMTILINWNNTVVRDETAETEEIQQPTFDVSIESN